jgi:hypothetical protein
MTLTIAHGTRHSAGTGAFSCPYRVPLAALCT